MSANIEFILALLVVVMFTALSASVSAFANKNSTASLVGIVLSAVGLGAVVCAILMRGVVYKNAVILDNKEQKAVFENIKRSLDNVPTLVNYKTFESYEVRDAYNEYMSNKKYESLFKEAMDAKGLKPTVPMTHSNTIWKPKNTSD